MVAAMKVLVFTWHRQERWCIPQPTGEAPEIIGGIVAAAVTLGSNAPHRPA
jgi:hypothetical protein